MQSDAIQTSFSGMGLPIRLSAIDLGGRGSHVQDPAARDQSIDTTSIFICVLRIEGPKTNFTRDWDREVNGRESHEPGTRVGSVVEESDSFACV